MIELRFWITQTCNFLRKDQLVFRSGCLILHSHQQCVRVPISLHLQPYLLLSDLLTAAILVGVTWHLTVLQICISLMTKDAEHLCICLLTTGYFLSEMPVQVLCLFLYYTVLLSFIIVFSINCSLCILNANALLDTLFENIFSILWFVLSISCQHSLKQRFKF